ncbi:MAG: hypothetical protein WCD35_05365 [Mycobacteriales bacterium]
MSTTHDPAPGRRNPAAAGDDLEQRRRSKRLAELLERRERLARIAVERDSHDLPDSGDYRYELAVVEQAIGHCWPDVWEQQFADWVTQDAQRMHSPERPNDDCVICHANQQHNAPPTEAA